MSAGQNLKIGDRAMAAEAGCVAARRGDQRVAPGWAQSSVTLVGVFNQSYDETLRQAAAAIFAAMFWGEWAARRMEVPTDGPAR